MSTDVLESPPALVRRALNGPTMGSRWSCLFFAPETFPTEPLRDALQAAVDRVDRQMSTWKPDSDLNRLNASRVGDRVPIPRELAIVLEASVAIGRASDGLFDIGVGDLVKAWGFGGGSRNPDQESIAAQSGKPRSETPKNLVLDVIGGRARKLAHLTLDLSGIAKGFGVDELARVMTSYGLSSFLVGIDGDMRARGTKPDSRPWAVGHEKPLRGARELAGVLELRDASVATSGSYRHAARVHGTEVSHTMNPISGKPLSNDVAAVTVLASTCMAADAWATALLVAGTEKGLAMARSQNLSAIFIRTDGAVVSTL